jgi:DNA-binding response OmpR family regulator
MLAKSGYDTIQAFSGTEAKLLLQLESPDLMILDLMLPGMTGEELISAVREEMGLNIPILVLSAKAALETKVHTLKSGADDYLTKPFEPEEVLAHVYAALRRYKKETDKKVPEIKEYVKSFVSAQNPGRWRLKVRN